MNTTQVIQSTFIVLFPPCAARPSRSTTNCLLAKFTGCAPLGEFNLTEAILKADFCFQNKFNLTGCAPLGEFNLSEAILKVDFCFQINLTGSAQFRTSQESLGKFEIGAPKMRNRIRISISNFARERTCRQTMSSYKTQISTCEIDLV